MPRAVAVLVLLLLCVWPLPMKAQEARGGGAVGLSGFATMNYLGYKWATDPFRRNAMELERLTLEGLWQPHERIVVDVEVEFEGGGTGTTMEFDRFEEFGEYEMEIEKGGAIEIEELFIAVEVLPWLNLRFGHFAVPIGSSTDKHSPLEYVTVRRSAMEEALLPSVWDETGIAVFGAVQKLDYEILLVNGLDATGFSSSNWITRGHQKRFEQMNAENLAIAGRLEYHASGDISCGASAYFGNSTDNRPKPDLTVPARVTVVDVDADASFGPVSLRGMVLYGTLGNADLVSRANKSLSNNLNVKRTPVGSAALGYFVEASWDVLPLVTRGSISDDDAVTSLRLFARYDYYDSMHRVTGDVFDNPRWERRDISAGLSIQFFDTGVLKTEYSHRRLGTASLNVEDTFLIGVGFQF